MDKRITVVLADANEEFRTALKQALEATGEFDVETYPWMKNGTSTVLIWRLKVLQALTEDVLVKWHIPKDAVIPLQSISTANRI